ncbi:MAG: amino acid permease [Parachlamydiales bacterium]|nr:amino acid permease [Parachlamydiales bacterium]
MSKSQHKLSIFVMAMMNVALVLSLRGLPMMAREGLSMIFYILFASVFFLLPVSLVSAELATGWPKKGGVYRWVKEAFGAKWGFTAIWLQWVQNTIWYSTVLAFAAGALSYLFLTPELASNRLFVVMIILVVYWGATFINFYGLKTASWLTTILVMGGTIFPALIIILLGLFWILSGHPLEFLQGPAHFFPDFSQFDRVAFLAGIVLLFSGMEVGAVHVMEMENPKKNYPKSILVSAVVIVLIFLLGSFAIAATIPPSEISLTAGIMQGFQELLHQFHIDWLLPILGFLVAFGAMGSVIAWIGGPSKGLLATAKEGDLPPFMQYTNKKGIQTHILWIQGAIVTVLSLVFLLMPNVSSGFFLLTALTATLYLIMYILLYASAIRLRYSQPKIPRKYTIPGGNLMMWLISGIGIAAVLFAIVVSFFPPAQLTIGSPLFYVLFIAVGVVVFVVAPLIINHYKRPSWSVEKEEK